MKPHVSMGKSDIAHAFSMSSIPDTHFKLKLEKSSSPNVVIQE